MEKPKSWCAKKHLRKVRSTDILIKRRSAEPLRRIKSLRTKEVVLTPRKVDTPKRKVRVLSAEDCIEIVGSPEAKRYSSVRKIDFGS